MKKFLLLFLAVMLTLGLVSCKDEGGKTNNGNSQNTNTSSEKIKIVYNVK